MQSFNRPVSAILLACLLPCATSAVRAGTAYVDLNSPAPLAPYASWATAATNIQDAIDAASAGDLVLVTNGVYQKGGRVVYAAMTNRVAVTKPLTLQSVNGPGVTTIMGYQVPGLTNGNAAVRCVYLTNNAVLSGFTLTNGATRTNGDGTREQSAGGVYCQSTSAVVSNCVLAGNAAFYGGGGALSGTFNNCSFTSNSVSNGGAAAGIGGGACYCTLNNCKLDGNTASGAGGAYFCTLNNCILTGNSAVSSFGGGGAEGSTLNNCILIGNTGGGTFRSTLNNCVMTGNSGFGASSGTLNNCISYYNDFDANFDPFTQLNYCCTFPLPAKGAGNFTNAPLFVNLAGGDLRLQSNSPCINSGRNSYVSWPLDFDGNPRIQGGTVDVGVYEFQNSTSLLSYAWLQQYGFPIDGSADFMDPDDDGLNNWQEWIAGTNPSDASSLLRMLGTTNGVSGITVTWQSVTNRNYYLQRASDLASPLPFQLVKSNLVGHTGTTFYTDTNANGTGPFFYRVGVQ